MKTFPEMPVLQPIRMKDSHDRRMWMLYEDYGYDFNNTLLIAPEGLVVDGASIPNAFSGLISPTGYLFVASLYHDIGYHWDFQFIRSALQGYAFSNEKGLSTEKGDLWPWGINNGKAYWDGLFFEMAIDTGTPYLTAYAAYQAVRVGGFEAWDNYRNNDKETR